MLKPAAAEFMAKNQQKTCIHEGCENLRFKMSSYCSNHKTIAVKRRLYGFPGGRKIQKQELKPYRKECLDLIKRNLSHEAIKSSIQLLDNWLLNAAQGMNVKLPDEMADLYNAGVRGVDILTECAAIIRFSYKNPATLPPERLTWTLAIGRAVLQMCKRGQLKMTPIRIAGNKVLNELGGILLKIHQGIDQYEEKQAEKKAKINEPFEWEG
jgi:hypothetical protein